MGGYVSKDFVHYGCGLLLEPATVLDSIPYSVRKNINKAESSGIEIERVKGTAAEIDILRSMWYDPSDPNVPTTIRGDEYMFIAYLKEQPVGVCILLPVGNHLFLNNLAGNKQGKEYRVQDYLLWWCVNYFADSRFKYIDVGVSYRPSLYKFFKKWQFISYPVIFNKPKQPVRISIKPFNDSLLTLQPSKSKAKSAVKLLKELTETGKFTFVPDIESAKIIFGLNNFEILDLTFDFPKIDPQSPFYLDLTRLFSVQFGTLLFNMEINDAEMWNKYHCLDVFKRELVFSGVYDEIKEIDDIVLRRNVNYNKFRDLFFIEDIKPNEREENIPSLFYFEHPENLRYHKKLNEFEIEHHFDEKKLEIGLPVHQNLTGNHVEYIYGIFRGVLNLCSEWEHTDKYDSYKG